jgi:hypothetical protein
MYAVTCSASTPVNHFSQRGSQSARDNDPTSPYRGGPLGVIQSAVVLFFDWLASYSRIRDVSPRIIPPYLNLFIGTSMPNPTKPYSASTARQGDFANTQKARAAELEKAENERAQKRLAYDARINVNATKWRYIGSKD